MFEAVSPAFGQGTNALPLGDMFVLSGPHASTVLVVLEVASLVVAFAALLLVAGLLVTNLASRYTAVLEWRRTWYQTSSRSAQHSDATPPSVRPGLPSLYMPGHSAMEAIWYEPAHTAPKSTLGAAPS